MSNFRKSKGSKDFSFLALLKDKKRKDTTPSGEYMSNQGNFLTSGDEFKINNRCFLSILGINIIVFEKLYSNFSQKINVKCKIFI